MSLTPHPRRVLVLGGTGFVGRRIAWRLCADGNDVRIPTRSVARNRELLVTPSVELLAADVHDEATLERLTTGCAAVINLVGILNEAPPRASFERVHVELARKIVRACRATGVRRLLQMSALKADPDHAPSRYLRSKGAAERVIAQESAGEIDYTIFRPSVIFGPDDSLLNRFARLLDKLPALPLAEPDARFAPVFVDDVAAAFAVALGERATRNRIYELCGPDIVSLEELVRLVARERGQKRAIFRLPAWLARLEARVGEWLPGKPLTRDSLASLGVASVCVANGLEELGIRARSLAAMAPLALGPAAHEERLARFRRLRGRA